MANPAWPPPMITVSYILLKMVPRNVGKVLCWYCLGNLGCGLTGTPAKIDVSLWSLHRNRLFRGEDADRQPERLACVHGRSRLSADRGPSLSIAPKILGPTGYRRLFGRAAR